jgi:hypothetical protein
MTSQHRRAYLITLVVAVVALLGSAGWAAAQVLTSGASGPFATSDNAIGPRDQYWGGDGYGQGNPGWGDGGSAQDWGPGMMGGRDGDWGPGMMGSQGDWNDRWGNGSTNNGGAAVTLAQARAIAQRWVDGHADGASIDAGVTMPGGYRIVATRDNQVVAVIMVDDDTGRVAVHRWTASGSSPTRST